MKKTILLLMLSAGLAFSQDLQKTITFQVNSNDLEILKKVTADYNQRIVQTNFDYKFKTNDVATVITNIMTMLLPQVQFKTNELGEKIVVGTNMVESPVSVLATNIDKQVITITNIFLTTNNIYCNTVEDFYQNMILPMVQKYHDELIKITLRDYFRNQIQQCTNEAEKSAISEQLKKYE